MDDDVTHAGHPWDDTRWCVNDECNRQAPALQAAGEEDE